MHGAAPAHRDDSGAHERLGKSMRSAASPPLVEIEDSAGVASAHRLERVGDVGEHGDQLIEVRRELIEHVRPSRLATRASEHCSGCVVCGPAHAANELRGDASALDMICEEAAHVKYVVAEPAEPEEPLRARRLEGFGEKK